MWVCVGLLVSIDCARDRGWVRSDRRSCSPNEPPRVCVWAAPDAPVVVNVGGVELVPGECAQASAGNGRRVKVEVSDGRKVTRQRQAVRVRPGETLEVAVTGSAISVQERRACTYNGP